MLILKIQGDLLNAKHAIENIIQKIHAHPIGPASLILVKGRRDTENELDALTQACKKEQTDFSTRILQIESEYLDLARSVLPVQQQSAVLSFIRKRFNEVDALCKGIQLLGDCPEKTKLEILNLPATVLSFIFTSACNAVGMDTQWIDEPQAADATGKMVVMADLISLPERTHAAFADKTKRIEVWTDRSPYYTADPEQVKNAMPVANMTFAEAMELSWQGNISPLPPVTLGFASQKKIEVAVMEMTEHQINTTIISDVSVSAKKLITGISYLDGIALIRIEGSVMIGVPGFAQRVFGALHSAGINVIMISQDASEHSICAAVKETQGLHAESVLNKVFSEEIRTGTLLPVRAMQAVSIIGLIGENMRNHPGISGRMFGALGRNGINILAIAQGSNERNISAVISTDNRTKAINVLHEAFFENVKKEIHLFIIGTGNVGNKLLEQISAQSKTIEDKLGIRLNLSGICNSRKMHIGQSTAIDPSLASLEQGEKADPEEFARRVIALNKRNSVWVDMTASEQIPMLYKQMLKRSISVVACNKIAASDRFETYKELKQLALSYNCKFLFETNVGAALPVIGTLNDLIKSGDRIHRIEAVLSGTLNYVFNHYDGSKPFAEVVRDAQQEGYTEPDPRLDLSGKDVMRKIMILAREAGETIEMEEIACDSFLPESCMKGDVEGFYEEMKRNESHFQGLLEKAKADQAKLKFVATYANGKASVGLKHIHQQSDMFHLYGKDNIVLFYTDRYKAQPLVVKGAGAGAEVTASGVFADIIRTINN